MLSAHVPDLSALELLLAVATTGSLGKAAAQRSVSQAAASTRLQRMEQLVGFPLLERGARGSTLTREGALLLEWAREVLAAAADLDAGITSLRIDRSSRLRVAASLTVAEHLLPRWLVQLAGEHPDTAVALDAVNSAEVAQRVLAAQADLGFIEGPDLPSGLDGRTVAWDRLQVVVPPRHPWTRRRRPLTAAELSSTRLVHREPTSGTRTFLQAAVGAPAQPLLELSSTAAVRSAVLAGAGPAVLSSLAVAEDVRAGRLVVVPLADLDLARELRAVWPHGQRPTGPARALLAVAARPLGDPDPAP
ncbi:LysR family transcriptional regulator [Kineococcus sp. GCM10028916]|uniref:LysR family transcriptional regulator n=1 Tax=Kineococcus sp. GCM10028916 TaxID=3273394 RepID=UPI00362A1CC2